jgi:hypothetical protein
MTKPHLLGVQLQPIRGAKIKIVLSMDAHTFASQGLHDMRVTDCRYSSLAHFEISSANIITIVIKSLCMTWLVALKIMTEEDWSRYTN